MYYRDGKLHRENGPADVQHFLDGTKEERYFLNGVEYRLPVRGRTTVERPAPKAPNGPGLSPA
jgi:hypothetical protein